MDKVELTPYIAQLRSAILFAKRLAKEEIEDGRVIDFKGIIASGEGIRSFGVGGRVGGNE
jgi:hypothetical protein